MKKIKNKLLIIQLYIAVTLSNVTLSRAEKNLTSASIKDYGPLVEKLNEYAQIWAAFIVVMALASFVYNIIALGVNGHNPQKRADAIRNICISGGVAALLPFAGLMLSILMGIK